MRLRTPHIIGIALIAIGIVAVLVVQLTGLGRGDAGAGSGPQTRVTGVVGSEKQAFFEDPEVRAVFAEHGLDVRVTTAGSFKMAAMPDLAQNDFAFPASSLAAKNIDDKVEDVIGTHELFFSPMAIATFTPILELLEQNGVASADADGTWTIDMAAYLDLVAKDTRWNQLVGAKSVYNSPRTVLITSTDIRTSNSAAMYLALSAYVLADNSVITSKAQAEKLLPALSELFLDQGYSGSSSAAPFARYLSEGAGSVPMVMIYEGQFLEELIKERSRIADGMVLAYPSPTFFSTHTGVTFSENGERVMQLIAEDPALARLLAAHGFRVTGDNQALFSEFVAERGLEDQFASAGTFVNIAQEPSFEVLDYLLTTIGKEYELNGAPPAAEDETGSGQ